jgi:hypothetical protein
MNYNQPDAQNSPEGHLQGKKPGYALFFVALALSLAIIIGSFWYANNKRIENLKDEQAFLQSQQVTSDPLANWKTYRNEEHGFEFKYPGDWFETIYSVNGPWRFQSRPFSENLHGLGIPKEGIWMFIAKNPSCTEYIGGNYEETYYSENIEYSSGGVQESHGPTLEKVKCEKDLQINLGLWKNKLKSEEQKRLLDKVLATFIFIPSIELGTGSTSTNAIID